MFQFKQSAYLGLLVFAGLATGAQAQVLESGASKPQLGDPARGFSYFLGLGKQTTHYSEHSEIGIRSESKSSTALLITGALYAVHPDFLVSLDNASSFAPANTTETWLATGATLPYEFDEVNHLYEQRAVNGPLLQTNRFSLSQNNTRLLAHYRATGPLFLVGGVNFHSQSFKRFKYQVFQPDFVDARYVNATTVVEETSSELLAEIGVALESERVKDTPTHYSLRASVAKPLWRQLQNTGAPDLRFNSTVGWDVNLEGRYSVAINSVAHIGGWAQYSFAERGRQSYGSQELPVAHTRSVAYGIELLWKL